MIQNANVLTITRGSFKGSVVIENGKIKEAGEKVMIPTGARIIDAGGQYLMPGIIDALVMSGTPLSILTKGTLLRRDLPLIADAAAHVPVGVSVSLAVGDSELQKQVEPYAN